MKRLLTLLTVLFATLTAFAQGDSPYARFGYEGKVLRTPQERQQRMMLVVPNPDTTAAVAAVGLDPAKQKYYLFDKQNQVLTSDTLVATTVSRFLSVDPLTHQFSSLTPYQFASNNPIAAVDLDGLEAATINPNTRTLVIVLQGYALDPPDNATQSVNAGKANARNAPDKVLGSIRSATPTLQVATYASSQTDNTKGDVLKTINNFRSTNKNGRVVLIGHSGGGDNSIELAKENPTVQIDLLITLDTQDPNKTFHLDDNNIPSNVLNAINYYQTAESIGGETIDFSNPTKGVNILSPGSNHRSIDNDQLGNVVSDVNNFLAGRDAVQIAGSRTQPMFDPKKSGSEDVFSPNAKGVMKAVGTTKELANPKSTR